MRMTCDSYLVPHGWITYLCCFFKEKPALMFGTQLSFDFGLCFSHFVSFSSPVMDFKTALTQGSGIVSEPNVPTQGNYVDNSSEELPSIGEEDLACCESFAKLFLVGEVLGESMPLKSISSKMKVEWKTSGESSFMDLGNDFFLIKFSTSGDYSKVWEDRPYFIKKQVNVLQRWREEFDPFNESLKAATLWARVIGLHIELWGANTVIKIMG